jgi:hypothetical protein
MMKVTNRLDVLEGGKYKEGPAENWEKVMTLIGPRRALLMVKIPAVVQSEESTEPITTPEIVRAWRPTGNTTDIWTVVSTITPTKLVVHCCTEKWADVEVTCKPADALRNILP